MDKRCKWKAGPTRTQRYAKTEMTPEAASSRSIQGHTGACQDRKAPAARTSGRNGRYINVFPIGEREREREREREDRAEAQERRNQGEGPIPRPTPHRGAGATEKNKQRRNFSSEATNAQRRGGQGVKETRGRTGNYAFRCLMRSWLQHALQIWSATPLFWRATETL